MIGFVLQTIRHVYDDEMKQLMATLNASLSVNGDGRFDSPGHSAMYGLYTLMDAESSKIVASSLMKVGTILYGCDNIYEVLTSPTLSSV